MSIVKITKAALKNMVEEYEYKVLGLSRLCGFSVKATNCVRSGKKVVADIEISQEGSKTTYYDCEYELPLLQAAAGVKTVWGIEQ